MTLYRICEAREGELFFDTLQEAKCAYVKEITAVHAECLEYLDVDNKELRAYVEKYQRTGSLSGPPPITHPRSCLCSVSYYRKVCAIHSELYTLRPHALVDCPRIEDVRVEELSGTLGADSIVGIEDGIFYGIKQSIHRGWSI